MWPQGVVSFLSHVRRDGEHLIWTGATDKQGYGRMRLQGKVQFAHRACYILTRGGVPEGHVVVASCGFRLCVMRSHLEAIPRKEFAKRPRLGARKSYKRYGPVDLFLSPKYRNDERWKHLLLDNLPWRTGRRGRPPKCRCHGSILFTT